MAKYIDCTGVNELPPNEPKDNAWSGFGKSEAPFGEYGNPRIANKINEKLSQYEEGLIDARELLQALIDVTYGNTAAVDELSVILRRGVMAVRNNG